MVIKIHGCKIKTRINGLGRLMAFDGIEDTNIASNVISSNHQSMQYTRQPPMSLRLYSNGVLLSRVEYYYPYHVCGYTTMYVDSSQTNYIDHCTTSQLRNNKYIVYYYF